MSTSDNTPSSPFGRGWIPASRPLGLPGEDGADASAPRLREGLGAASTQESHSVAPHLPALTADAAVRRDGFTPERQARFLHHLAGSGSVRAAAARVGVSPQAVYVCRRRSARFAAAWDAALVLARDAAEQVLAERALEGVEEAVFYHGEEVARRRRFDTRLLLAWLARLDRRADGNADARRRAGRFDELLASLAGAEANGVGPAVAARRHGAGGGAPGQGDPFLPAARADHIIARTEGLGPRAWSRARARAEAEWDRWQAGAEALVDRLTAPDQYGPEKVGLDQIGLDQTALNQSGPDPSGPDLTTVADGLCPAGQPIIEYKSIDAPQPAEARSAVEAHRRAGVHPAGSGRSHRAVMSFASEPCQLRQLRRPPAGLAGRSAGQVNGGMTISRASERQARRPG